MGNELKGAFAPTFSRVTSRCGVVFMNVDTKLIYDAVYNLIKQANTILDKKTYDNLASFDIEYKNQILQNAHLAKKKNRPLCQDTGQVVIFLEIGQNICLKGEFLTYSINKAVEECYKENFYRKSTVKDALYDRSNCKTNTPAIIHTEIVKGDKIEILIGLKGGGAENMTQLKMMNPTSTEEDIITFAKQVANDAGENACPPMVLGIGAGGTAETAALLAKKALFKGKSLDVQIKNVFETKILTAPTHIASLPVCVNINCHSFRHASCNIIDGQIIYNNKDYDIPSVSLNSNLKKINTSEIDEIKNLASNEEILLSGTIYTARDMAHKKIVEMLENKERLPFKIKDSIIFYAGPCPSTPGEIIGPVGPTTSKRMDEFTPILYKNGLLATIGKGDRNLEKLDAIYFKLTGGVACLIQDCIKKSELIAFEELESEAVFRLEIEDLPLKVCRI